MVVAAVDGWGILIVAGGAGLLSLVLAEWTGVLVCLLACVAGWVELQGRSLLATDPERGYAWLRGSQLWLLTVIVGYATWMLWRGVPEALTARMLALPQMDAILYAADSGQAFFTTLVERVFRLTYGLLIVVSCLYQGGMWWYYRRAQQREVVRTSFS